MSFDLTNSIRTAITNPINGKANINPPTLQLSRQIANRSKCTPVNKMLTTAPKQPATGPFNEDVTFRTEHYVCPPIIDNTTPQISFDIKNWA